MTMNNKVTPHTIEEGRSEDISVNEILRAEEWDFSQAGLDEFGRKSLLFQREVELIQKEEEQKETVEEMQRIKRSNIKGILFIISFGILVFIIGLCIRWLNDQNSEIQPPK